MFSEGGQRVWLVDDGDVVRRTYLVSGSMFDNLDRGTYAVYSRSENAIGIDDSGSMRWFVRFAYGDTGAAIGFHDIPVDAGERVQTVGQLGTPHLARLHPAAHRGRQGDVAVRTRRHDGRRRRLTDRA